MAEPNASQLQLEGRGAKVRLESLWKVFPGDVVAVRDANLTIVPGEFITLLGPSGSGKTTTLMMVAGFVKPSHGEIWIGDASVARLAPQKRNLGMVFQNYALFPHMTVFENVAFPLDMRRVAKREVRTRVARALEMVQLSGYEARYPRQLSGGQQQRVALARAVVFEPQALLMDEPLGALDKKLREHMQLELKHIQQRLNVTVIYVTHDQEEALTMSDRIAVMHDGRIEQVGSPTELYEEPTSMFVADFIGESNFLAGTVREVQSNGLAEVEHPHQGMFRAAQRGAVRVGDEIVASVRPERLIIGNGTPTPPPMNCWKGRVSEIIYVGDATKYKIEVGNETLTLKEQNRDAERSSSIGDEVDVVWSPSHTKLLGSNHADEGVHERDR